MNKQDNNESDVEQLVSCFYCGDEHETGNCPDDLLVKSWTCKFCDGSWSSKEVAIRHLHRCDLNPATKSCGTCKHYSSKEHRDGFYIHICRYDPKRKDTWLKNCNDWAPELSKKT